MKEINIRFREIRKELNLNQADFGKGLGLTTSGISNIEKGVRSVTDKHVILLKSAYNINEEWLRTGKGEIFIENDSTIITELANEYRLDAVDKKIIEHYVKLDSDDRKKIKDYVLSLARLISENEVVATSTTNVDEKVAINTAKIDEEIEKFRMELEAEQKGETLLVSEKPSNYAG